MENDQIPVVPIILGLFAVVAFVLFLVMLAFIGFLISRAVKRRSYDTGRGQQMQEAAGQLGLDFRSQAELAALPFLLSFEFFEGNPLKFENLMTGMVGGHNAAIFDLAYRNVGGQTGGTTTSRQTMCVIESSPLNLTEFYLRPEGLIETALNTIARVDIDFAARPDFSRKFLLYGKDDGAIRHLFTEPKLDFFEKNPHLSVFGGGKHLCIYQSRFLIHPAQLGQYLQYLSYLHDLFRQ